jgi:sugar/nucleoside kinase (ribokinase family)
MCDTMNFWIDGKRSSLIKVLEQVDIAVVNDAEARQITGTLSTIKAAREIQKIGPKIVIIKKGEHGALLFHGDNYFAAPSYPFETIVDPTGAGDSFAGGFIGYVAATNDISEASMRRAVIYGSVMASFNVEDFSLNRMRKLTRQEIEQRFNYFKEIAYFDARTAATV